MAESENENGNRWRGIMETTVGEHERRLVLVEQHPLTCSAAKEIKEVIAWKNKWAGAIVVLQVVSLVLGIIAFALKR